jgi:hypothetical protein
MRLTLPAVFTTVLFIGLFVLAVDVVKDPDFWWHLRTGQYIAESRSIPRSDPSFAFTTAGKQWITHEWLSELLIWKLHEVSGLSGLSLFFAGLITAAFALMYLRSPGKPYVAGFATLLGALAAIPVWNVRPQIFTLFLLSLLILILETYFRNPRRRLLIPLPFMMLLWVNLHGGFLLGLVVMAAYLLGKALELYAGLAGDDDLPLNYVRRDLVWLVAVLLLCLALVGVHPAGYRILIYPLATLSSPAMQTYLTEWYSPNFHETYMLPLAVLLLGVTALGLFVRRRFGFTVIGLLAMSALATLRSVRNAPLFAVIAAPVLSSQLAAIVNIRPSTEHPPRRVQALLAVLLAVICLLAPLRILMRLDTQAQSEREEFPAGGVDWIAQNAPRGSLFNTYHWGGYVMWRLNPRYQVFIDGRADLHGDEMLTQYAKIYNTQSGWEQALRGYGIHIALVEPGSLIAQRLAESPEWRRVYSDETSVVYLRE